MQETDFLKSGSVAVLRSLIRILRASLAQINTEMDEKYAKLAEKFIRQTRQGCKVPSRISYIYIYIRYPRKESGSDILTMIRIVLKS